MMALTSEQYQLPSISRAEPAAHAWALALSAEMKSIEKKGRGERMSESAIEGINIFGCVQVMQRRYATWLGEYEQVMIVLLLCERLLFRKMAGQPRW